MEAALWIARILKTLKESWLAGVQAGRPGDLVTADHAANEAVLETQSESDLFASLLVHVARLDMIDVCDFATSNEAGCSRVFEGVLEAAIINN